MTSICRIRFVLHFLLGVLFPSFVAHPARVAAASPDAGEQGARPAGASTASYWLTLPRAVGHAGSPGPDAQEDGLPLAPSANARARSRRAQRGDAATVDRLTRGPRLDLVREAARQATRVRFVSRWLSAVSLEVTPSQRRGLERRFGATSLRRVSVFRVDPLDRAVASAKASPVAVATAGPLDYGDSAAQIQQIQVDRLHALGLSGAGVRVLMLDTGYRLDHPALTDLAVVDQWDFVWGDGITENQPGQDLASQHNHGTGVLGTMAAFFPGELVGPAYRAEFLLAKTENVGFESRVEEDHFVAALEWGEALGADLATASLTYRAFDGGFEYAPAELDGDTAVTTRAVDLAVALGMVAVIAIGNDGPEPMSLGTPADADSCIAVGSVTATGAVSGFSSRGPTGDGRIKPDVAARGQQTVWAAPGGGFAAVNGTSVAAPLVAGAAALLMEAHPLWDPIDVVEALRGTASQSVAPDQSLGYGIVRAHDALFSAPPATPFPFELIEPAPDASGPPGTTFRWRRALDLQTPEDIWYSIHASSSTAFEDTLQIWSAGPDSLRSIDFLPGQAFHWRVLARDGQGNERWSQGRAFTPLAPTTAPPDRHWVELGVPTPNPFNPSVSVALRLDRPARLQADVYDVAGRHVARLVPLRPVGAGRRTVRWEGRDGAGRPVATGSYLLRVVLDDRGGGDRVHLVRRLLLLR